MATETVTLKIKRGEAAGASRWETFEVPRKPMMNVISCLMEIRKRPVTAEGRGTTPIHWEASCLEEVCGACTMVINGRVRQACSALVKELSPRGETITLEPMTKFPRERDLVVDRRRMFDALVTTRAWIEPTRAPGPGPKVSPDDQAVMYPLSRCMTCGCCVEACPSYNDRSDFMGPQVIALARLYNLHPAGRPQANARLDALMGPGGIAECGKAQNCVQVCPKGIALTDSIAVMGRATARRALFGWLLRR